jgi:hypothetical protein
MNGRHNETTIREVTYMATTINYGMNTCSKEFPAGTTVQEVITDSSILGFLSAPEDIRALSNGSPIDGGAEVAGYSVITLDKVGSSKA